MKKEKKDNDKVTGFSFYDLVETDKRYFSSLEPSRNLEEILNRLSTGRLPLNPEIVKQFSTQLGLGFDPNRNAKGNVCFVNHEDVRPEYRLSFGHMELVDYLYAVLHESTYSVIWKDGPRLEFPLLPYPKDADVFWKRVQKGSEVRQNRSSRSTH